MNAEHRHDKKKNPADFSMLILRLEKQIIDQKDPSKISRILKDERIWKALNAQQQVKWSNLAQMAGEVETACRVLMHINQFSSHTEEAWQNHLLLLSVLDNKKELARILALSRKYVDEKLYNQWVKSLRTAAVRLRAMEINVLNPGNIDVLRGMEGAAARVYYSAFRNLIRNESFSFNGRNRRPPLDPVNAMLSFVYTMLTNEVLSAIKACGLDPYLGSLHEVSYGRPSLACDLVEEYRCFLGDRLVLGLINRKVVKPDDFIYRKKPPAEFIDEHEMKSKRPVEMKPAISRAFVSSYEQMMRRRIFYEPLGKEIEYRWLILNQVRQFGKFLENPKNDYKPFVWEN